MTASAIYLTRIPMPFQAVMEELASAAAEVAVLIRRGGHPERLEAEGAALEERAAARFQSGLQRAGVRWYASLAEPETLALNPGGCLAVAMSPLDGAAGLETNLALGTIFSIYRATADAEGTFLRAGSELLAAGYVLYGPSTSLVVSFGDGTQLYRLNPETGQFELIQCRLALPEESGDFAINTSNYRHWARPVRAYVDDCLAGTDGPRAQNFNMRWVANLVAEAHRILMRGGIYLSPADRRKDNEHGRLHLLFECAPIAFVIEQAGGRATDGCESVLRGQASQFHERTPFVFGSSEMVDRVATYHDLPETEVSALFGNRGLFRA
ncbi:class 1 fructose-bisphosphatase [Paracoccus aminophilus]|uniref:Fructose-1,6-bisphosphatase class 1 n=1 Tax=Paracoccus aminophilus JCM 7686 TaxID=1367847 RepID=S5YXT5_PARAH|nr:class 1 fructose-bisphosphatase [Paracoccus aminophilus]AGT10011.1 fructose-1,6-bisphosphatase I [Paracoccus aminophilus JCM 7686]